MVRTSIQQNVLVRDLVGYGGVEFVSVLSKVYL